MWRSGHKNSDFFCLSFSNYFHRYDIFFTHSHDNVSLMKFLFLRIEKLSDGCLVIEIASWKRNECIDISIFEICEIEFDDFVHHHISSWKNSEEKFPHWGIFCSFCQRWYKLFCSLLFVCQNMFFCEILVKSIDKFHIIVATEVANFSDKGSIISVG